MPTRGYDLIDANDWAVQLLHQGLYARAIQTLESALQFLRRVAVETSSSAAHSSSPPSGRAHPIERTLQLERQQQLYDQYHRQEVGDLRVVASSHKCKLWNARCPEGEFSFCSRPMILVGRQDQVVRSSHNQNRAAATLMYNLSLAHQGLFGLPPSPPTTSSCPPHKSSSSSPFGDRILTCSLKVCAMATDLISRLPDSVCTPGDSILFASALNNQGFLHVYFANRADANRTMSLLEKFFASRSDEEEGDNCTCGDDDGCDDCCDDYRGVNDDHHGRIGSRLTCMDRDGAHLSAVDDVAYSVLLCQGRTVLDAAPAA